MNNSIIKQMSDIVAEVMTSFQSDFEQYDKQYIEKAEACQFPMIWMVGTSHTYLLKLGEYKDCFLTMNLSGLIMYKETMDLMPI